LVQAALGVGLLSACSDASSSSTAAQYQIVAASGGALEATVGDAFRLSVVEGSTAKPVSNAAKITWSGPPVVTALPEGSTPAESILPAEGASVAAMWVDNPDHLTAADVAGVLYVLDAGSDSKPSVEVTATITDGTAPAVKVTSTIPVAPFPSGDATRGQPRYAANCASCHGDVGEGGVAPGLNDAEDNVAGDPDWTPQLLGVAAKSNMDNDGVSLATSMPKWLTRLDADGKLLTVQDFADIYAYLKTQGGS
jgi:mono/diheme cytochrome c family protein